MITREVVAQWRREGDLLLDQAAAARSAGDPLYAEELEACAVDYQQAALDAELELAGTP